MIINLILLGSVLGIGVQSWREQKRLYNQRLLAKQQQITRQRQANEADEVDTSRAAKRRTATDMFSLSTAMGLSSIGYWLYPPLAYLAPPFILYAVRKRFYITWRLLKKGQIDVETLSTLSIIGALIGQRFFIGSLLAFVNALGDILTARVIRESHHQLVDIYQDMPKTVWLIKNGVEIAIPLSEAQAGDTLVVSAGEVIPADGQIVWGIAGIDEHRFTGESMPVEKTTGDNVFAMTMVLSGKIHLQIEKAGAETSAMKIAAVLNQTADYKSLTVLESEAFSRQLIKPALIASTAAWPLFGFNSAVGVLYAHPKERLKVAAPLSLLRYLKRAMGEGMLIKDGRSLELLNHVDTIVFDKTGTLTAEQPHIGHIHSFSTHSENDIIYFAASAEHKQSHPLAQAILYAAKQRNMALVEPEHSEYHLGYGVKVVTEGNTVVVGSARFMHSEGIVIPAYGQQLQAQAQQRGHGYILVAVNQQLIGYIELLPTIRPEAKAAIQKLKQLPQIKKTYIISGDAEAPTAQLAQQLGIDHYFAQTLPQQKAALITQLQQENRFVCYVGDGINDAIAMKQAQVSISLNGASQLATDTAQILLLDQGITHIPRLFELSQGFNRHMQVQMSVIIVPSVLGISTIFLTGMGMSGMMLLNMLSLSTSIGYSLLDRPTEVDSQNITA